MKKATFKIRRKIILAFLFCFMSVLLFAVLSLQTHREIGHRLRVVELADDLVNNILEIRRFEKNFFLYKQPYSLVEAMAYADRVENLYKNHEHDFRKYDKEGKEESFLKTLALYKVTLSKIQAGLTNEEAGSGSAPSAAFGDPLRGIGQELLDTAGTWARDERRRIEKLFRWAFSLFVVSMCFFGLLGIVVAMYISKLMTKPLVQMQQAMEKIADGDFTPIPEQQCRSEEFLPLFAAFNRMIHELEERQDQLVQARKISAIGTFTSGIAHELNNPVNNIVLTAETLKEDYDDMEREEALGMIGDIIIQSERASEIIKNLLDFSRAERPEMESISIPAVIRDTLKLVSNQLLLSGVEQRTEVPDDLPLVCGHHKSLQQVFLNLFINAVHAMPDRGTLTVTGATAEDGKSIRISVGDTGVGINAEDLPHIFDPFFTTKEVGKGTGLGLSVTYGILRKHGGNIEVRSKEGVGTTFTVILPVRDAETMCQT